MLKMYVLIRDDMSEAQQAVQAGHAVAKFGYDYPGEFRRWQDDNNTLIYLSVKDIDYWATVLKDGKFKFSVFHEPELKVTRQGWLEDFTFETTIAVDTAIAVAPNWYTQYTLFKDLPLAMSEKPEPEPEPKSKKWWKR